jgi:hypothetical protein
MYFAIVATVSMFAQHVKTTSTGKLWTAYNKFGSFPEERQQFLFETFWEMMQPHLNEILVTVSDEFFDPGVVQSSKSITPYLMANSTPDVFSPFHLIAQSILCAYVFSPTKIQTNKFAAPTPNRRHQQRSGSTSRVSRSPSSCLINVTMVSEVDHIITRSWGIKTRRQKLLRQSLCWCYVRVAERGQD